MKMALLIACGLLVVAAGGCAASGDGSSPMMTPGETLTALERARFKGHVKGRAAGTPLALHITNSFELGPREGALEFEGQVDFSQAAAVDDDQ